MAALLKTTEGLAHSYDFRDRSPQRLADPPPAPLPAAEEDCAAGNAATRPSRRPAPPVGQQGDAGHGRSEGNTTKRLRLRRAGGGQGGGGGGGVGGGVGGSPGGSRRAAGRGGVARLSWGEIPRRHWRPGDGG